MKNILILIIVFYFLVLLQTSFMVYFSIPEGITLNLVVILAILINFFEKGQKNLGILSALIGGFFLDIFSSKFFGFWILILLLISLFLKLIFRKHVRIPFAARA